jgi:hypothetical protein
MNINGHYMDKPEADRRVREIAAGVQRIPFDDPLRPYFDFLLGYIDDLDILVEETDLDARIEKMAQEAATEPYSALLAIKI